MYILEITHLPTAVFYAVLAVQCCDVAVFYTVH